MTSIPNGGGGPEGSRLRTAQKWNGIRWGH